MITASHGNLVALPFNAAATRKAQHENGPTAGLTRAELWRGITSMMDECWEDWHQLHLPMSYNWRLRDRFHMCDWKPERIKAERNAFLAHESFEQFTTPQNTQEIHQHFVVVDAVQRKVLGELQMMHHAHTAQTCSPYDAIRPSERHKGLSYDFLKLCCTLGRDMGYTQFVIGVEKGHDYSNKRLQQAVTQGWAVQTQDTRAAHNYTIDLQKLPAFTA